MQPMAPSAISARGLFLLQVLVELAQERDEDIPALVYEARPAGRASARQRQQPSPAELQGVTVEAPALGSPTEGASSLCWGSVKLLDFLCLPRSGNPNTPVNPCRKGSLCSCSCPQGHLEHTDGVGSDLTLDAMHRMTHFHFHTLATQTTGVVKRPGHQPCCSSSSTPATTAQLPGLLETLPGRQWTPLGWPPWE